MIKQSKLLRPVSLVVPGLLAALTVDAVHHWDVLSFAWDYTGGGQGGNPGFDAEHYVNYTGWDDDTVGTKANWFNSGGDPRDIRKYGYAMRWVGGEHTLADYVYEGTTWLPFPYEASVASYYEFYTTVYDVHDAGGSYAWTGGLAFD